MTNTRYGIDEESVRPWCEGITLSGEIAQVLELRLRSGQGLWCARGALLSYSSGVDWRLGLPGGAGQLVGRMMTGEGMSLVRVDAHADDQSVVIASNHPGKLATWNLDHGAIVCAPGSFIAALGDVSIDVTTARSPGAMLFGGAGLFLQRLSGTGVAVVHGAGDLVVRQLAAGEKLVVATGNVAVFSDTVDYGIRGVGGCGKMMFGGEGIFMTELTGPGWVMLQTLKRTPPQRGRGHTG